MYTMDFEIVIDDTYRLTVVDSITVNSSVEQLSSSATIVLPSSRYNKVFESYKDIEEGLPIEIRFGYLPDELPLEFSGYIESISTDGDAITLNCEDEIYYFRREIEDKTFADASIKQILEYILLELDNGYTLECDYDFSYDKFTIHTATAYDILKKIRDEARANVYIRDGVLYVHQQYSRTCQKVVYDFTANVESADLKYKDDTKRKFAVTAEGSDSAGQSVSVTVGRPGGDKATLKIPGVSDKETLKKLAEEELKTKSYTGYEGSITGWLLPAVKPGDVAVVNDEHFESKNGSYYVVAVETKFSKSGGSRKVTLGKKMNDE